MQKENDEEVMTGLKMEKRTLTWRITNFDLVRQSEEFIKGQRFQFEAGSSIDLKTKWMLSLTTVPSTIDNTDVGGTSDNGKWIGVNLKCTDWPAELVKEVNGDCQIVIKKSGRVYYKSAHITPKNMANFAGGGTKDFRFPFKKDTELKQLPLNDGCLVIHMELHIYAVVTFPVPPTGTALIEAEFQQKFNEKLQSDLGKLLANSSQDSDSKTKIISMDDVEFGVNKTLLSVRSPVFGTMLGTDMEEGNTGVIQIDDLCSKTIAVLLRYMYTGTLHADWSSPDVIVELVYAAEKYELADLKEFLNNVLGRVCSKETAGKLLKLVKMMGMKIAEKEIFEWVKKNILSSEDLASLF